MITIISSTNRPNSNTLKVANQYSSILQEMNEEVQVLDFCELPKGFLFDECFGNRSAGFESLINEYIVSAEKIIFIIPEYNGGFPGVLKGFVDAIPPRNFNFKKAALVGVSTGHAGNLRGLDAFTNVLNYLKVNVFYDKPKLSGIDKSFANEAELNEFTISKLKVQAENFLSF